MTLCKVSHACDPNARARFVEGAKVVYALKAIAAGAVSGCASLALTDYSPVDMMVLRCKFVNIGTFKVEMLGLWFKFVDFGAR